jgi:CspA family cold shock protein
MCLKGGHMYKGKIKRVIEGKSYGFIKAEDGREIFFHMSGLQGIDFKDLKEGDPVEFDVKTDIRGRGPKAVNVRRASSQAA